MATTTSFSNMLIAFPSNIPPKLHAPSSISSPRNRNNTRTLITTRKPTLITTCIATKTNTDSNSSPITQQQVLLPRRPTPPKLLLLLLFFFLVETPKLLQADISSEWRKLMGEDDWAGLLDPMNPDLRAELIRYGDMTQAMYDSFDYDTTSKYCGSCMHLKEEFFQVMDMAHLGYSVTSFLYSTLSSKMQRFFSLSRSPERWSGKANWAGYVAVSDDETSKRLGRRDITVAWRGTITKKELKADFRFRLRHIGEGDDLMVETGFFDVYTQKDPTSCYSKFSAREQLRCEVKRLVDEYQDEELSITITGHSLGAALATLSAFDIAQRRLNVKKDGSHVHVSALTFASPKVGNGKFKERLESLGVKVLRVHNTHDIVPLLPLFGSRVGTTDETRPAPNIDLYPWWNPRNHIYCHVGVDLEVDHAKSPHLKTDPRSVLSNAHNLEVYLHLLDGYQGRHRTFESGTGRDFALVNKSCDFLKHEHLVPPAWWHDLNKGLVKGPGGHWRHKEREIDGCPEDIGHYIKQLGI